VYEMPPSADNANSCRRAVIARGRKAAAIDAEGEPYMILTLYAHLDSLTPFFSAAAGVTATLWIVSIALLTLVLATPTFTGDLGFLSEQARLILDGAASRNVGADEHRAHKGMMAALRCLWFLTEFVPIVVFVALAAMVLFWTSPLSPAIAVIISISLGMLLAIRSAYVIATALDAS
jgi:hypothetical protein